MKGKPSWLLATFTWKEQGQYQQRGRPKKEATPDQTVWYLVPQLEVDQHEVTVLARKKESDFHRGHQHPGHATPLS